MADVQLEKRVCGAGTFPVASKRDVVQLVSGHLHVHLDPRVRADAVAKADECVAFRFDIASLSGEAQFRDREGGDVGFGGVRRLNLRGVTLEVVRVRAVHEVHAFMRDRHGCYARVDVVSADRLGDHHAVRPRALAVPLVEHRKLVHELACRHRAAAVGGRCVGSVRGAGERDLRRAVPCRYALERPRARERAGVFHYLDILRRNQGDVDLPDVRAVGRGAKHRRGRRREHGSNLSHGQHGWLLLLFLVRVFISSISYIAAVRNRENVHNVQNIRVVPASCSRRCGFSASSLRGRRCIGSSPISSRPSVLRRGRGSAAARGPGRVCPPWMRS